MQPDPSAEILPCVESLQQPSLTGDVVGGDHSEEVSDLDSDSGSGSEPCPDSVVSSENSPLKETSSEIPKDQTNLVKTSPQEPDQNVPPKDNQAPVTSSNNDQKTVTTTKKRITDTTSRTLRNFSQKEIHSIWFDSDRFLLAVYQSSLKKYQEYLARIPSWAADLIFNKKHEDYFSRSLVIYTRRYLLHTDLTTIYMV